VSSRFVFTLVLIGGGSPSACSLQWEVSTTHSYFASPEDRTKNSTENTGELSKAPSTICRLAMGEGWKIQQDSCSTELFLVYTCKQYFFVIRSASDSLLITCQHFYTVRKFFYVRNSFTLRTTPSIISSLYHWYSHSYSLLTDQVLKFRHYLRHGRK